MTSRVNSPNKARITYNLSFFRTKREADRLNVPIATNCNINMHEITTQEKGAKISR